MAGIDAGLYSDRLILYYRMEDYMRKREDKPRKHRKHDEATTFYTNKRGMENRIVSFRMNEILYERLYDYAVSIGKDPSACIREAVGVYLRERYSAGREPGSVPGRLSAPPVGHTRRSEDLMGWTAVSRKLLDE